MFKKTALVLAAALAASPAAAAGTGSTQITGVLPPSCSITAPGAQTFNPALTSVQGIGSVAYQCNFASSGATIKFWSANGGKAVMPAGAANGNVAQELGYSLQFGGNAVGALTSAEASTLAIATPTMNAANVGQSSSLAMQLSTAASIAGTYSDVIWMSINP